MRTTWRHHDVTRFDNGRCATAGCKARAVSNTFIDGSDYMYISRLADVATCTTLRGLPSAKIEKSNRQGLRPRQSSVTFVSSGAAAGETWLLETATAAAPEEAPPWLPPARLRNRNHSLAPADCCRSLFGMTAYARLSLFDRLSASCNPNGSASCMAIWGQILAADASRDIAQEVSTHSIAQPAAFDLAAGRS